MRRPILPLAILVSTASITAIAFGCGDGGGNTPTQPDPVNTAPTATINAPGEGTKHDEGADILFQGTGQDTEDGALTDASLIWTSDVDGQLGQGGSLTVSTLTAGDHEITLTVSDSEGLTDADTVGITVLGTLVLTGEETLSGTEEHKSIDIPAGVTVTVSDAVTLTATQGITVEGNLEASCVAVSMEANGVLSLSGSVSNSCDDEEEESPPALTLIGKGGLNIDGAVIESSGEINLGAEASDESQSPSNVAILPPPYVQGPKAVDAMDCTISGATVRINPAKALPGQPGANLVVRCGQFPLNIIGGVTMESEDGGDGISLINSAAVGVYQLFVPVYDAEGLPGQKGGDIILQGNSISLFKPDAGGASGLGANTFAPGEGGAGGSGTATARLDAPYSRAAYGANAKGGDGGAGGSLILQLATQSFSVTEGSTELVVGAGGKGGAAVANGADGKDADDENPAQEGGLAFADGGKGGAGGTYLVTSLGQGGSPLGSGSRTLAAATFGDPTYSGGAGGEGGAAHAKGGNGGSGNVKFPNGAMAPGMSAMGGDGGEGGKKPTGEYVGDGGNSGQAVFTGANGGTGWSDCEEGKVPVAGGNGGSVDEVWGGDGMPGNGKNNGTPGGSLYQDVANGGNGGDGEPPGSGGEEGYDETDGPGPVTDVGRVFQPGTNGDHCPVGEQTFLQLDPTSLIFMHFVGVTSCPQNIGSIQATNTSTAQIDWTVSLNHFALNVSFSSGTLAPGQSVAVPFQFNCGTTSNFEAEARFTATDGQTEQEFVGTITSNIQFQQERERNR